MKRRLSPLRKKVELVQLGPDGMGMFSRDKWRLECGHEIWVSTATMYRARCVMCRFEQEAAEEKHE